ncbi:DUF2235 domain-containing protein [Massilia sp. ST3]|uniref:DUF2235 domain-containing protein n=1 Tax=Massilia sp. ST3 TaxID=2824903 RepID=UPI001B824591|nr:DUF2235 domain-containing protein [Massilia sp. ST3]MBQ5949091.1 DUF2235 domain-containing protein [Massilia sp. ST3]
MRKLVLFSDGTGNSSAKAEKTNVWRMFQALDQGAGDQVAKYDDGVGTSPIRLLAMIGGAFGWGLKRNVLDLYKFLCREYRNGDLIYAFGFSRGAFTIRVLASLIASLGLVEFRSEEELDRRARIIYRLYRNQCFPAEKGSPVWLFRLVRNAIIGLFQRMTGSMRDQDIPMRSGIPIEFLGLWDTVSAYGMPVEEFKPAVHWLVWPMYFDDLVLSPRVRHAYHALSLDDERTTFHPLVWDETAERRMEADGDIKPGRMQQVWFSGVHANVGGGYPEDQLSLISLHWMMENATRHGLRLIQHFVDLTQVSMSPYARLYDSRAGLHTLYRYTPRQIRMFEDTTRNKILPVIHWSVILRLADATDQYAPVTLPTDFEVLAPDGKVYPLAAASGGGTLATATQPQLVTLRGAMLRIVPPNAAAIELALDTVWWRRLCYLVTVFVALVIVAFPLYGEAASDRGSRSMQGLIEPLVTMLSAFVPSQAERWIAALRASPIVIGCLLFVLAGLVKISSVLQTRIRDRAMLGWHAAHKNHYIQWLGDHHRRSRNVALGVGIAGIASLAGAENWNGGREIRFIAALLIIWSVWRIVRAMYKLRHLSTGRAMQPGTWSLNIARALRKNPALVALYRFNAKKLVPAVFVVLMLAAAALIGNRAAFDALNSVGLVCTPTRGLDQDKEHVPKGAWVGFMTNSPCLATGMVLERGGRYRITFRDPDGAWFDRAIHTDMGGFPAFSRLHWLATPLKRWWSANWFAPIGRVGQYGNEEYVLEPGIPYRERRYGAVKPVDGNHRCPIPPDEARTRQAADPTPPERRTLIADITARSTGELFLFVNDAVYWPPNLHAYFYSNNLGSAVVTVERLTMSPSEEAQVQTSASPGPAVPRTVPQAPPLPPFALGDCPGYGGGRAGQTGQVPD